MRFAGDDDLLAAAQLERGFGLRAVDRDVALIEQQLHARAADAFKLRGEEVIEALAGGLGRDGDGARFIHGMAFRFAGGSGLRRLMAAS